MDPKSKYLPFHYSCFDHNLYLPCHRTAKFGLFIKGQQIGVSVLYNTLTKFGKLAVGKHLVTAKQQNTGDVLFPLIVVVSGLSPLTKVWVNYLPYPKNVF